MLRIGESVNFNVFFTQTFLVHANISRSQKIYLCVTKSTLKHTACDLLNITLKIKSFVWQAQQFNKRRRNVGSYCYLNYATHQISKEGLSLSAF